MQTLILIILVGLVVAAVPIAAVLGILGLALDEVFTNGRRALMMGDFIWEQSIEYILVAVPMFILLGEIILRAGIATRMYTAVAKWLSWLPGGLMHANVGSCAVFAATSGSSVATVATVGTVAYPEIEKRQYNEPLFLGTLAAGGTLGILIPPSIALILYGLLTDTSVPELYLAGVIPGAMLALFFMLVVIFACFMRPGWGGSPVETSWRDRLEALPDLLPPLVLFAVVVGSIYTGLATPTEAASIGVVCAIGIAAWFRALSVRMLIEAFESTMCSTAMVMIIILAAVFLNFVLGFMGVTQAIIDGIDALGWTPMQTMMVIIVFYLLLGMFMETLSMMLTTIPVVFPIVAHMGFDPVWFGIMITVLMEAALITPPIGLNLYVVHGTRTRGGKFNDVSYGALPFLIAMLALIGFLLTFPDLATWLPNQVY
ncbi:TRAP dicarboxylate transporter [Dinoroseobacter shibae DFL 12 = DSM 16493]|jgi:tripartite ATP-independent transporter DctM subunit|uniref:TRAP transporter large permease protein n=1 Tax=Dinoroseobacter shibae (strain DSM 16493 / NCIMB 14021 / DFL 12) TaxID=398580 RepID=A8LPM8_DINSH|nr:TRAP transporter large permease [Dinoroseobacter shibae]ABV92351.1 TRAP dicarboxylate transporter [Dinoroseobacter shibae DFL 12 = DSM 16493]URF47298.1 TRAP transporter large permease [Dinoroseobacter shibae]URF51609.1 TRAP transporter large permease [Dinoroseobacter shibae]